MRPTSLVSGAVLEEKSRPFKAEQYLSGAGFFRSQEL